MLTVMLLLSVFSSAPAQQNSKLKSELEKTDQIILRATDAVREAGSAIGKQHVERAKDIQVQAKDRYRLGMLSSSLKLTLNAREQAEKAVTAIRASNENSNTVRREIERTEEALNRAHDKIHSSGSARAESLFDQAVQTQSDAKEFFRGNRLRMALKATLTARDYGRRAVELAGSREDNTSRVEREIERTADLIEKARTRIDGLQNREQAEETLARAADLLDNARMELKAGNLRLAAGQTLKARNAAMMVLQLADGAVRPERIEKLLEKNDRLIEDIRESLEQPVDPTIKALFDVAVDHQMTARQAFADGNFEGAVVEAKAALSLLNKVLDSIGNL